MIEHPVEEPLKQNARRELDSILDNPAQLTTTTVTEQHNIENPKTEQETKPSKSRWEQLE